MGVIEKAVRLEVERAVDKALKAAGLSKELKSVSRKVADVERRTAALEAGAARGAARPRAGKKTVDGRSLRFSPATLKRIRGKLGITQGELAVLLEVSGNAVWQWEAGRAKPRRKHITALRELAKIGKREARRRLLD